MNAKEAYQNSLVAREKILNETFDMVIQKIIDTSNKGGLAFHIFHQQDKSDDNNKLFFSFCQVHKDIIPKLENLGYTCNKNTPACSLMNFYISWKPKKKETNEL